MIVNTLPPILVLGATGRIGSGLVKALQARDIPMRAAMRNPMKYPESPDITPIKFDLLHAETWLPALEGIKRMFLMWPPGTSPKQHLFPFIDKAKAMGVARVAFLSVLGADRMGFLPHRQIERYIETLDWQWVFLRAGYFMQNFSSVHCPDIRDRDEVALPTGKGRFSMVDAMDVSEAACVGLTAYDGNLVWNLTGPAALNMEDVAQTLSRILARPIRNAHPGPLAFFRAQVRRGTPRGLALFMVAEYTHARLNLAGQLGTGVQTALGREPTSFETFAQRERAMWQPI